MKMKKLTKSGDLLLRKCLEIQSSIADDREISDFIIEYAKNIEKIKIEKDRFGNIYLTKGDGEGGYPCVIAHTDTVHDIHKNRKVLKENGIYYAISWGEESEIETYAERKRVYLRRVGVGGDDKVGVYIALRAMESFKNIKTAFFRFEETGCNGSRNANMDFFSNTNFVIQCDRYGNKDFITTTNGLKIASEQFEEDMKPIFKKYGYSISIGISTDVGELKRNDLGVSAVNIASGYYYPHTDEEIVVESDVAKLEEMVFEIIEEKGHIKYGHKKEIQKPYNHGGYQIIRVRKNSYNNNFFTKEPDFEEDEIYASESMLYNYYSENEYKIVKVDGIVSKLIKRKHGILEEYGFHPGEGVFYSVSGGIAGATKDEDMSIYREAIIKDYDEKEYVYDRLRDIYYQKENAEWDEGLKTYILKNKTAQTPPMSIDSRGQ